MFSATKIAKIFDVYMIICSKCQIDGENFFNICGLIRKYELYILSNYHLLDKQKLFSLYKVSKF